jgi:hypothetical protein
MLTGAGLSRVWSHHRVHRFFSRAAWDPRKVGLALAGAVIDALVPDGAPVRVAVEGTLLLMFLVTLATGPGRATAVTVGPTLPAWPTQGRRWQSLELAAARRREVG